MNSFFKPTKLKIILTLVLFLFLNLATLINIP